jgi:hypothetical protein
MRTTIRYVLACALGSIALTAAAVDTTLTPAGYTGLGVTPNAHLLAWGRVEGTYDNQLPGVVANPRGHNFVTAFGLLPNLEISVRMAANSLQSNCFTEGCGTRDLSASAKVGIGLDTAGRFRIGAGVTDVGGAVAHFRSYYGVLTYNEGSLEASAGLAKRSGNGVNGSRSPLDGPFASAAWTPLPWVRGQIEYTDRKAWAGLRLFAPKEWLPEGWTAYVGANQRLTKTNLTEKSWLTAGLSIPLYKVPDLPGSRAKAPLPELTGAQLPAPVYEARTLPPAIAAAPAPAPAPAPARAPATVTSAQLDTLAAALQAKGLEDIYVGSMPDGSVAIRANNASYNWNSADAIGAALGVIARTFGDSKIAYRLVLTQRQVPLVGVTGQADCLREWIANAAAACTAGELSTPGTSALDSLHRGATWQVSRLQPSWQTLRVRLSPVLRTSIGTDFGVFDVSAGINAALELPLWNGASVEWSRNVPLANSSDYERGALFGSRRVKSETERLAFTQTVHVPLDQWVAPGDDAKIRKWGLAGVTAQGTVGRVGGSFDGAIGSLRWEPGDGHHRVTAQAGRFRNADFGSIDSPGPKNPTPVLASYRYNLTPTRTFFEGTAGQFFNNDRGFQVGMRQWFSDVAVNVYYRRTRVDSSPYRQMVGIQLSVPIGPRQEMAPLGHVQVTGTPRFSHAVETTVREGASNPLRLGLGVFPPAPSLDETFNSDRSGLVYFEDNVRRIRDAAR